MNDSGKIIYYHAGRECRLGAAARFVTLTGVRVGPFPDGLSSHGEQYVLRGHHPDNRDIATFEYQIEEIRAAHYPLRPSRFVSLFASRTVEDAREFGKGWGSTSCFDVREIECEAASVHDMAWISAQHWTVEDRARDIHRYWKGLASRRPVWEVLVPLRVWAGPSIETHRQQGARWVVTKAENDS